MEDEYPWPKRGMSLFATTDPSDWRANAVMPLEPHWISYQSGYRQAAELLMARTASGRDQDSLIYPILFNARQAIELELKAIVRIADRVLGRSSSYPKDHPIRCHKLIPLWRIAKDLLKEVESLHDPGVSEEEETQAFEVLLHQLHSADPTSFTFRYPTNKNDRPSFDIAKNAIPSHINTRDLSNNLCAMFNYLSGVSEWLIVVSETLDDLEAYYR